MAGTRRHGSGRRRRAVFSGVIVLATLATLALTAELVLRHQLEGRLEAANGSLPGVTTSVAGGPALLQFARGRVGVTFGVTDRALDALVECRTDPDIDARSVDGGIILTTERSFRGVSLPIEIRLVAQQAGDEWSLVADSVSAAGVSIPAKRALRALAGNEGSGSRLADRLLEGIALPDDGQLVITSVHLTQGLAEVTVNSPIHMNNPDGGGGGLAAVRECLEQKEG